ncbi:MAG: hypothetical protein M3Z20_01625 [Chloroflexota bacterium]|nr:hypothetical protein [Chloroflexota bacterium]
MPRHIDDMRWLRPVSGVSLGVALALMLIPAGVSADSSQIEAANGGEVTATADSELAVGDIATGENTGHAVTIGDTTDGGVSVIVGDVSTDSATSLSSGEDALVLASASGGDETRLPGRAVGDVSIDVTAKNDADSDSDSTATGGAGGAGGIGQGGAGGSGGEGGAS